MFKFTSATVALPLVLSGCVAPVANAQEAPPLVAAYPMEPDGANPQKLVDAGPLHIDGELRSGAKYTPVSVMPTLATPPGTATSTRPTVGASGAALNIGHNQFHNQLRLNVNVPNDGLAVELAPVPAAQAIVNGGTYKLLARHSGKALDVVGASTDLGANVRQWEDNGTGAQQWIITTTDDGYFKLLNKNSGQVLEVAGLRADNSANVQQGEDNDSDAQQWKIEPLDAGYYRLTNRSSGNVLTVVGGPTATADGDNVEEGIPGDGTNQQWALTEIPAPVAQPAPDTAPAENEGNPN